MPVSLDQKKTKKPVSADYGNLAPRNEIHIYVANAQLYKSLKEGKEWKTRWELVCLAAASLLVSTLDKSLPLRDLVDPFVAKPIDSTQCGLYPGKTIA